MVKIQYFSDIHLEMYDLCKVIRLLRHVPIKAPLCVLAGDIGYPASKQYEVFLKWISNKFEHVFLITGNHEYYSKDLTKEENDQKIKDLIYENEWKNIHFLHPSNPSFDLPDTNIRFIGSTLWTSIEEGSQVLNDAYHIKDWSYQKQNEWHFSEKAFLQNEIEKAKVEKKRVVVITHHLPSLQLIHPKYRKYGDFNKLFASSIDELISDPVLLWIYGHTHTPMEMEMNGVKTVTNPIGYPGENIKVDFGKVIEIS